MYYSALGIIAIIIHLIINFDVITERTDKETLFVKDYRHFQTAVLGYYVTDALWGIFSARELFTALYVDTLAYYIALAFSVIYWCKYVVSYLELSNLAGRALQACAALFGISQVVLLVINFFTPIFFSIDDAGNFHTGVFRYAVLVIQILMFVIVAIPAFMASWRNTTSTRKRGFAVCACSVLMVVFGIVQTHYPLIPLYTIGLMIGICIMHVFVHEDEKAEVRRMLQENEEKLRENSDIIANAGYGVWKISRNEYGQNTMAANDTLQMILGISDKVLSPEDLYNFFHSRIIEGVNTLEQEDYAEMRSGKVRTRILAWEHPAKGKIYLSTGGTSYTTASGEQIISGYCADITKQKKRERRANLIIESLARSYELINLINMKERTFFMSHNNFPDDDVDRMLSKGGDVQFAIDFACEKRVSEPFRKEMRDFTDLSTVDARMGNTAVLINQFKNMNDVWFEWSYIVADRNPDGTVKHLIWAVRKIEDEKQAEQRKQRIIDDNIAANKAKTIFLHNMSHEIRTPLNALFGFAQLLGLPDGTWSEEEKDLYNANIFNSYNMLEMLIADIIDIADSDQGNYRIEKSDVSVNSICRSSLMSVEYRKPEGVDMVLTSEVPDDFVVCSDGRRIQQVLVNYLTNACKYTQHGKIHLHCSNTEMAGRLVFSVTDTGTGVPKEKADLIFQRFTKLDDFVQGSGLGLNICKMVAEKLGGEVFLDKEYTGGARFVFVLPV
ncbi:MAG: HAMP domain-containing histidine kinase [Bacteroidaceae bacterium]|nr:HAMP domain-containing histidine kinase [Bacteroidaceae bacterium]